MEDNMTSKQRAYLKSLAMKIDPIYNIGNAWEDDCYNLAHAVAFDTAEGAEIGRAHV